MAGKSLPECEELLAEAVDVLIHGSYHARAISKLAQQLIEDQEDEGRLIFAILATSDRLVEMLNAVSAKIWGSAPT